MSEYANYDDFHDEEYDNEYDSVRGKKNTFGKILKKTVIFCLEFLAILVFAVLIWRVFSTNDPKTVTKFLWNEAGIEAYNKTPGEFLAYEYDHNNNLTPDGKFAASSVYFVPLTGQFQITLRYNDSTVKYLIEELMNEHGLSKEGVAEEFGITENTEKELFVFTLTDNLGNTYTDYEYISDTRYMYNYRRLIFDGIDMSAARNVEKNGEIVTEKFEYLVLNVYFIDDVLLSKPYGTMPVYDNAFEHVPVDLDKYMFKNNTPTQELKAPPEYTVIKEPEETTAE